MRAMWGIGSKWLHLDDSPRSLPWQEHHYYRYHYYHYHYYRYHFYHYHYYHYHQEQVEQNVVHYLPEEPWEIPV